MTGAAIHAVMASACLVAIHLLLSCSDGGRGGFCPGTPVSEGDIALRRGRGLASRVVIGADPMGKYSHIGIVARAGDGMVVVHSVPGESDDGGPDKVKAEPLQSFFSPDKAAAGALMHFRGDTAVAGRASRIALELARRGVLFDHDYDLGDTSRLYCTEMVVFAYSKCGVDITGGRRTALSIPGFAGDYIFPSDICESTLFEVTYKFN